MKYPEDYINKIIQGDCLEVMRGISDKSIDMILCDLPYGTTACSWDTIIPFEPLWKEYKRIIKDNGAIVLTASQPFTSKLVMSNLKMFKYELIWEKSRPSNFMLARKQFLKSHEDICIFYKSQPTYNPGIIKADPNLIDKRTNLNPTFTRGNLIPNRRLPKMRKKDNGLRYPRSIVRIKSSTNQVHPTQKPVALFEYLIKTYTNEEDIVLDNCIGSGTTAVACKNLKRNFIGIEISEDYCKIARDRLKQEILL